MLHPNFIWRQAMGSKNQALLFILCVVLSMVILVAISGLSESVDRLMRSDARKLHGGDIIIRSRFPISGAAVNAVHRYRQDGSARLARTWRFYSMVKGVQRADSLLASLKVVSESYPLYGTVVLKSGRSFQTVLKQGAVIVEQSLLDRLKLKIGDRLRIGNAELTVADVLLSEPDRPVNVFSFGPRIFVSATDLSGLDLLGKGSRITYRILLKTEAPADIPQMAKALKAVSSGEQEQVDTYRTARSRLKRFFDNLIFFLNLVGTFTLVLAGIGIYSSLTAMLREQEKTIAILKAMGATRRFVTLQYLSVVLILGGVGTLLGIVAGILLQFALPLLFEGFLPENLSVTVSWKAVAQGMILGLVVVSLFAFLPVYRLGEIKPGTILRKERIRFKKSLTVYAVTLGVVLFFSIIIIEKMQDLRTGGYFLLGIVVLVIVTFLVSGPVLWFLKRFSPRRLVMRQALKGLFRPGNATRAVIITMTTSMAFIFSIYLVEENLNGTFIESYPPEAPNLFFLDIQPDQKAPFSRELGTRPPFYPVIRSKILSINDRIIDRRKERRRKGDNLGRTFNLTYRHHLLKDEIILKGRDLFPKNFQGIPVSILDTVAEMSDPQMAIGDKITFRIQGIPITATVTSIRSRVRESINPFFYFVLPDAVLRDAPQTIFTAIRLEQMLIPELQNRIVEKFPNITIIDATRSMATIAGVLERLSSIVRFFTLFSLAAGILLIISSVFATRFARIQESVYYKILGANSRFVMRVFTLENLIIGGISGSLALLLSHAGSLLVCRYFLNIPYHPSPGASFLLIALSIVAAVITGWLPSLSIIRQKPMPFLKSQTDE